MTFDDLVSNLRTLEFRSSSEYFHYLAEHATEITVPHGSRITDVTDFKLLMRLLAIAFADPPDRVEIEMARNSADGPLRSTGRIPRGEEVFREKERLERRERIREEKGVLPELPRWNRTCPDCGDVHESEEECGVWKGGAGFCKCTRKVPA